MRPTPLCVLRLLLSLVLVAFGGLQGGGFRLLVQHIETLGPRQWLGLVVATSLVPATPITQRFASTLTRRTRAPAPDLPADVA